MKKLSEEHKKKIGLALSGRKNTFEHNRKISLSCSGKTATITTKLKLRASKTGDKNPNWKGGVDIYRNTHSNLVKKYGGATICENRNYRLLPFACTRKSSQFDWAKKTGSNYTLEKDDYYQLCRSCHKKYDMGAHDSTSK